VKYRHCYTDGTTIPLPVGKVVCVGRNYREHARELNNPVPDKPVLFMKPSTALVALEQGIRLPHNRGSCHHEVELAVLIGQVLSQADAEAARTAAVGYAVALDLTLRDLQCELKQKGLPWETAKAFDGACPISPFLRPEALPDPQAVELSLAVNGHLRQQANTNEMLWRIFDLIGYISRDFTLLPGDVVLTGTPAGVAELRSGDELDLSLGKGYSIPARVA
jgi:2-keto-4-pentenoate hydratase/2-oxohepta-3-ene-1,7-dioic acid hydratase in catechol pathway